jgi:hypothetical protein
MALAKTGIAPAHLLATDREIRHKWLIRKISSDELI